MTISANFPNVQPSLLLDFANAKQLPPQVTFTRATTATYYDGHTTAMAEQNLFKYSNDVTAGSYWTGQYIASYTATTAPDGTSTAVSVLASAGTGISPYFAYDNAATVLVSGGVYTYSFYAKAGTHSLIQFTPNSMTTTYVNYDLSSGVLGNTSNATGTITSVGSGWYRCTATYTAAATSFTPFVAFIASSTAGRRTVFNPTGTETLLFWGAQVEQRSSATAYTATTTQAITNYNPVLLTAGGGQPRFDHNPTTSESLGLLIEEQRTNLFSYSQQFDDSYWTKVNCTITANANAAPDGTLSADLATASSSSDDIYKALSKAASAITYTLSVYMKVYSGTSTAQVYLSDNVTGQATATFNITAGTLVSVADGTWSSASATITSVGNGWFRCTLTATSPANTGLLPGWNFAASSGQAIFIWGAQLEVGAFPSSYIPTTSAAATRAADVVSMTGANFSSWYSPGNGTFYAEASTASVASDVMIAEGTNSAGSFLDFSLTFATTSTQFINRFVATSNDMRRSSVVSANTMVKFGGSITNSSGTTIASTNGVTASSTGNQGANFGADRMFIGSRGGSSLFINAPIRKLAFYPAQLTQTQQNSITG